MTQTANVARAGYTTTPSGTERTHSISVLVVDRIGSVDRVVGLLRRKRAKAQALTLVPTEQAEVVRITAQVQDTDVSVDHLVEQLRKIVDVQRVTNVTAQETIVRELALIKVNTPPEHIQSVIEAGKQVGAVVIDTAAETLIFEVSGNEAQIAQAAAAFQPYGISEIARSGNVTITRGISTI